MEPQAIQKEDELQDAPDMKLFWACFIALVTTAFAFILRALILPQWGIDFNLTKTQLGEIAGVGLWPFAISIVLFSLIIDKVGYKTSIIFAFVCHVVSAVLTIFATGYWMLYIATFIMALGNGTVEAVVNPVVATMFPKDKTKWLSILHAGWPGGLVLGGVLALVMGTGVGWEYKIGLLLLPTLLYGLMFFNRKFPIQERIKAGVPYMDMLKEVGVGGALIIVLLMVFQIGEVFDWPFVVNLVISLLLVAIYGYFVRTVGKPLFIILLLLMIPLAVTELGTDSWISDLMASEMANLGLQGGWILVYTSAIMVVLRLFAGRIIHKISPLGLLAASSAVAAFGLVFLSMSVGTVILVAATVYGFGKAFFWPSMLGVVAERFPRGGALTLNITGGVGMIGAGVIGAVILGFLQDSTVDKKIQAFDVQNQTELHASFMTEEKKSLFGEYRAIDLGKLEKASSADQQTVATVQEKAKKEALLSVAVFPIFMLVSYLALIFYFKSIGGYKPIDIHQEEKEPVRA